MSEKANDSSVIIVGGSLVGLSAALFLAQRNVPTILLERHTGSSPHPRAIGYTTRTMELLRAAGLESSVPQVPAGMKPRRTKVDSLAGKWYGETTWGSTGGDANKRPSPSQHQAQGKPPSGPPPSMAAYSPCGNAAIAQDKMEPILRQGALSAGADLRLGWKMTSFTQSSSSVTVTATSPSGTAETLHASYLIAADGATSPIRETLSISRTGIGYLRTLRSILFSAPSLRHYLDKGFMQFSIEQPDFTAFMVTYMDDRWALMSNADKNTVSITEFTEVEQVAAITRAVGHDVPDLTLLATGTWDLSALIATRFSSGRVFLAGDAAHALPPNRGGYGANTGIHDAHNLAWKLAAVLSGESEASLLDTYDAERRPVSLVRHDQIFAREDYKAYVGESGHKGTEVVIDDVAMELGQIYRSAGILDDDGNGEEDVARRPDEWAGRPGTRAPHVKLVSGKGEEISSLDLLQRGWVLLSGDRRWTGAVEKVGGRVGVEFVLVGGDDGEDGELKEVESGQFAKAFGVGREGASLIRPDGVVAWRVSEMPLDPEEVLGRVLGKVAHLSKGN
ncbi:hypothetical protein MMC10_009205 [Thelotrema lepadinum]|nr:hypothetical protein [Thelotrema lepadinum]